MGIVVTRAASPGDLGEQVASQFARDARVYWIAAVVLLGFALLPGFPWYVLIPMAFLVGFYAFHIGRTQRQKAAFGDALALALFSVVRETGRDLVRFELTRESAVRGFDQGIAADAMLSLLDRLSGSRTDQHLCWTLRDWEQRYAAVALYQGITLTLSEERRYLAETGPLASMIARTLAPGVYVLLPGIDMDKPLALFQKAGVDIVARPVSGGVSPDHAVIGGSVGGYGQTFQRTYFSSLHGSLTAPCAPETLSTYIEQTEKITRLKERFSLALTQLSLSKEEREELEARIDRRLILSEAQLSGASVRYEKMEARGLDYVGKAALARQALSEKSLLELFLPQGDEGQSRVFGFPVALEKQGGELVLVINPQGKFPENTGKARTESTPAQENINVPLGKISLLRRIKTSIFGD
jgi:hypothetical protein